MSGSGRYRGGAGRLFGLSRAETPPTSPLTPGQETTVAEVHGTPETQSGVTTRSQTRGNGPPRTRSVTRVRGEQRSLLASVRDFSSTHFGVRHGAVRTRRSLFSISHRADSGPPSRRRRIDPDPNNGFEILEGEEGDSSVTTSNLSTTNYIEVEDHLDPTLDPNVDLGLDFLPPLEEDLEDEYYDNMAAQDAIDALQ